MTRLEPIADPIRLAVVRHLATHGPAAVADLAKAAGVHLNTVRAHMAALEQAGLVLRDLRPPSGRGRRRVEYRLVDDWVFSPGSFLGLAELLAQVAFRRPPDAHVLRRVGRQWASKQRGRPASGDPAGQVTASLESLGFHAEIDHDIVRLSGCPCPLVAPEAPELVCQLAVGAIEGAGSSEELRVTGRVHDPNQRRCRLSLGAIHISSGG